MPPPSPHSPLAPPYSGAACSHGKATRLGFNKRGHTKKQRSCPNTCSCCCCCFGEALTHVFVHTRKIRKTARLATNSCTTGATGAQLRDNRRSAKNGAKCAENPFTAAITSTAQSQNPTSLHDHRDDHNLAGTAPAAPPNHHDFFHDLWHDATICPAESLP